ncbi:M60 family metallopeptidase [Chitinophaga qingshengii]|uniref:Peptidase M60 domain-containing protein n=1 Tax=Chitinophaga qingshengii TaxID=1569794 RepID=A0ABR7TQM5_9BACT|nr:M60 family metallopeptidase [Chitinophaga qingshengii]MBC9932280.1 hypothetical protein [Chitinophaga qingshengii]
MKRLFFLCLLFATMGCSKKYGYDFKNGFETEPKKDTVTMDLDTSMYKVDRSQYTQARVFPGMMDVTEPRLKDYKITLNLAYMQVRSGDLRVSVTPQPYFSTGLFAPAGELLTIDVPEGIYGLQANVGAHTDNLAGVSPLKRAEIIYTRTQLFPGRNYIRNLYGGTIWIIAARSLDKTVTLNVSGAAKSADFVLGETTDADWLEQVKKTTVPWLELRGKRMVLTIPKDRLQRYPLESPTLLMQEWDKVIALDYNQWLGLSDTATDIRHLAPQLPWRIVMDVQPVVGYAHSGFPVVCMMDDNWFRQITSADALTHGANWGAFHEIGHNMQQGGVWSWPELGEVSNNLYSFKVDKRNGIRRGNFNTAIAIGLPFAATVSATKKYADLTDLTGRLAPFIQIFEKYGYGFFTELHIRARNARFTSINTQDKVDFFYECLCDYTTKDMEPFMNAWGLYISNISKGKMSAKYPLLTEQVWKYDPR